MQNEEEEKTRKETVEAIDRLIEREKVNSRITGVAYRYIRYIRARKELMLYEGSLATGKGLVSVKHIGEETAKEIEKEKERAKGVVEEKKEQLPIHEVVKKERNPQRARIFSIKQRNPIKLPIPYSYGHLLLTILDTGGRIEEIGSIPYICMKRAKEEEVWRELVFDATEKRTKEWVRMLRRHRVIEHEEGRVWLTEEGKRAREVMCGLEYSSLDSLNSIASLADLKDKLKDRSEDKSKNDSKDVICISSSSDSYDGDSSVNDISDLDTDRKCGKYGSNGLNSKYEKTKNSVLSEQYDQYTYSSQFSAATNTIQCSSSKCVGDSIPFSCTVLVDIREKRSRVDPYYIHRFLSHGGVNSETRVLPVGDFVWMSTDGVREYYGGVVMERKTVRDLEQSVRDGRYREQKERLLSIPGTKIYLIEGSTGECKKMFYSAVIGLAFKGFLVVNTQRIEETLSVIGAVDTCVDTTERILLEDLLSNSSRKGLTDYSCRDQSIIILQAIKGVSYELAVCIVSEIGGIFNLIRKKEGLPHLLEEMAKLRIDGRKAVGRKKARKILSVLGLD